MTKKPYVFIYGGEGIGSSIDADRKYVEELLPHIGLRITSNPLRADYLHFIWWDQVYKFRFLRRFSRAKWIATVTNTIDDDTKRFGELTDIVDLWVAASKSQYDWLENKGVNVAYQPFFVDESIFHPLKSNRSKIINSLHINPSILAEKVVIGSFQRDTQSNLINPKWQKGPEFLLEMLKSVKDISDKWILLIAGPRRHWIIEQCELHRIPYIFVGTKPSQGVDDITFNTLSPRQMANLYNITDLYIVSSQREGGPKAIIESILCETPIISRPVGLSSELIDGAAIFANFEDGVKLLKKYLISTVARQNLALNNSLRSKILLSRDNSIYRWKVAYSLLGHKC